MEIHGHAHNAVFVRMRLQGALLLRVQDGHGRLLAGPQRREIILPNPGVVGVVGNAGCVRRLDTL